MKHLFFVSVALGIFSGTSISGKAQTSVNLMRLDDGIAVNKSNHFSEKIEIKPETTVSNRSVIAKVSSKKNNNDVGLSIENCTSLQFKYGQLMNKEVETITNYALYNFIDEWWATRYRYGGTTKAGIDCSAFSGALLSKVFGIRTPRTARAMFGICEKIKKENLQEGDLVFFNTRGGVSHVGVYLGAGNFTHASVGRGVTISNLDEAYYSRKFIGGGRVNPCIETNE